LAALDTITPMSWNPFRAAEIAAKADREVMLATLAQQHEQNLAALNAMQTTAGKMADAAKAQAESFTAYLSLFKVSTPPESRVHRDQELYEQELRDSGFPVDAPPEQQAEWVLRQTA
jgi:hypothetical protein